MSTVKSREEVSRSMHFFMNSLGIEASDLPPAVHIAGTKGKGSTAAITEAILRAGGLRTGLFTSPHLISPVERFRINGEPVGTEEYCSQFWRAWTDLGGSDDAERTASGNSCGAGPARVPDCLPGFNFLTLLAFRVFIAARVDVMVLEVGVGGLLDATNVLPPSRVLASGITQLDYDHTDILGPTLSLIAAQKAGIAKANVPLCVARDAAPESDAAIKKAAIGARTHVWSAPAEAEALRTAGGGAAPVSLRGRFQRANAALAVSLVDAALSRALEDDVEWPSWSSGGRAVTLAAARSAGLGGGVLSAARSTHSLGAPDGLGPPPALQLRAHGAPLPSFYAEGLARASWPGRAQIVELPGGVRLCIDGAHTSLSMQEVAAWFLHELGDFARAHHSSPKPALIFYCGPDKDALSLMIPLSVLLPWESVLVVAPSWSLTPRNAPPSGLESALAAAGERANQCGDSATESDVEAALSTLRSKKLALNEQTTCQLAPTLAASWPSTLVELWDSVNSAPELGALRRRAALALGTRVDSQARSGGRGPAAAGLCTSVSDAVDEACRQGCTDVLITGSLYLVGDALKYASQFSPQTNDDPVGV